MLYHSIKYPAQGSPGSKSYTNFGIMRYLVLLSLLITTISTSAQHCPWDCSGLLMLKTDATREEMKRLDPVLVDINKNPIDQKQYADGTDSSNLYRFLFYDDFLEFRLSRIKKNNWNMYDTVYHFAKDHYVVRINYCGNRTSDLFVRYNDPAAADGYKYIEIPPSRRIHLHDYSNEINRRETEKIIQSIEPFILTISRKELGLL